MNSRLWSRAALVALLVTPMLAPSTPAAAFGLAYTLRDLGKIDGATESGVGGIDSTGRVVGYAGPANASAQGDHAVIWSGGSATDLPRPPGGLGSGGRLLGATTNGDAVGYTEFNNTQPVWWHQGSLIPLTVTGNAGLDGIAFSVNDAGQVVGYVQGQFSNLPRPYGSEAVLWQQGVNQALGRLPGDFQSVAYGINQAGLAVGYSQSETGPASAVAFSGGRVKALGLLAGDTNSEAFAVNANNEAVGYSSGPARFHATAFCAGGTVVDLGTSGSDVHSQALAINSQGTAVGDSDIDGFTHHAVLFGAGKAKRLDNLVSNLPSGWTLARAAGINDSGMIAAEAIDRSGTHHAVELTPLLPMRPGDVCTPGPQDETGSNETSTTAAPPLADGSTIFVHWDYMVLAGPDGYSDAPNAQSVALVQQAFARQHLKLWIDPTHKAIPERVVVDVGPWSQAASTAPCTACVLGNDHDSFYRIKSTYFPTNQPAGVRYALFDSNCGLRRGPSDPAIPCSISELGVGEISGKDLVIDQFVFRNGGIRDDIDPYVDGAWFMHELGHTLGLNHGGADKVNGKPNYLSVMNYLYAGADGIPFAAKPGSSIQVGKRLDYSGQALPDLDQSQLNETVGLQSGSADLALIRRYNGCGWALQPSNGPVDYNSDGNVTDTSLAIDLLQFCANTTTPNYQVLHGFNDWAYIKASLPQDISVISRHVGQFAQSGSGTYQITVTNSGVQPVTGASFVEDLPPGWGITAMYGPGWSCAANVCTDGAVIAPGASAPTVTVNVIGGAFATAGPNLIIEFSPTCCAIIAGDWTDMIPAAPVVTGFSPMAAYHGAQITVAGSYIAQATQVDFPGGSSAFAQNGDIVANPDGSIAVTVPGGQSGTGPLIVHTPGGVAASSQPFSIAGIPTISGFTPTSGPVGTIVNITGTNLNSVSAIEFPAASGTSNFTLNTDGSLSVAVPQGSGTGPISVSYSPPGGGGFRFVFSSQSFTTTATPCKTITGFSPTSGPVGTTITITGSNLIDAVGPPTVIFGGAAGASAQSSANPDGSVSAIVPAGASSGPLTATSNGTSCSATSRQSFTVT